MYHSFSNYFICIYFAFKATMLPLTKNHLRSKSKRNILTRIEYRRKKRRNVFMLLILSVSMNFYSRFVVLPPFLFSLNFHKFHDQILVHFQRLFEPRNQLSTPPFRVNFTVLLESLDCVKR